MKPRLATLALFMALWAAPALRPGLRHVLQHGAQRRQGWAAGHQPWSAGLAECLPLDS